MTSQESHGLITNEYIVIKVCLANVKLEASLTYYLNTN